MQQSNTPYIVRVEVNKPFQVITSHTEGGKTKEIIITYLTEAEEKNGSSKDNRILFYSLCGRIEHTLKQKKALEDAIKQDGLYNTEKLLQLV